MVKLVSAGVFLLLVSSAAFCQSQRWTLAGFTGGVRDSTNRIEIAKNGDIFSIRSFTGAWCASESTMDADGNALTLRVYAQDGECSLDARVNGGLISVLSNGHEKSMSARPPVVLSDPSNYLAYSLWLSQDTAFKEKLYSLYQHEQDRNIEMRLTNKGIQAIAIGGKPQPAYLLEMALASPIGYLFWPHVYKYWYAVDDFHFLAYEGPLGDGRISRIENSRD
jgi:hypothetical protein